MLLHNTSCNARTLCASCTEPLRPVDTNSHARGGQTFPKSTEFRNSIAFRPFFAACFRVFQSVLAESVSEQLLQLP